MKRTIIIECPECKGTGLIRQIGGAAIMCTSCSGTGKTDYSYNEFEGRKEAKGVTRVYQKVYGQEGDLYIHCDQDYEVYHRLQNTETSFKKETVHMSKYGCTYEEWKKGVKPKPAEELYCPAEYVLSIMEMLEYPIEDYLPISRCRVGMGCGGCVFFETKEKCWEVYHQNSD